MKKTLREWLEEGMELGFILPPPPYAGKEFESCYTHDGVGMTPEEESLLESGTHECVIHAPMTSFEAAEFEAGGDPCIHIIRLNPNQ